MQADRVGEEGGEPECLQLFLERTGRESMIVTGNRKTAKRLTMFDDMLLAQSVVDRSKNAALRLRDRGESYRPRIKPNVDEKTRPRARAAELTERGSAPWSLTHTHRGVSAEHSIEGKAPEGHSSHASRPAKGGDRRRPRRRL